MTAHIIVFSLVLFLFFSVQRMKLKNNWDHSRQTLLNIPVIFLLLPLAFPGVTVIADYLFEGFTDNLLWFSIFYIPILSVSLYYLYRNLIERKESLIQNIWTILMGAVLICAYVCAILSSHHESGATPVITDSAYLMFYFSFINFTLILTFANQVNSLVNCQWTKIQPWIRSVLSFFLFIVYVVMTANTITESL